MLLKKWNTFFSGNKIKLDRSNTLMKTNINLWNIRKQGIIKITDNYAYRENYQVLSFKSLA